MQLSRFILTVWLCIGYILAANPRLGARQDPSSQEKVGARQATRAQVIKRSSRTRHKRAGPSAIPGYCGAYPEGTKFKLRLSSTNTPTTPPYVGFEIVFADRTGRIVLKSSLADAGDFSFGPNCELLAPNGYLGKLWLNEIQSNPGPVLFIAATWGSPPSVQLIHCTLSSTFDLRCAYGDRTILLTCTSTTYGAAYGAFVLGTAATSACAPLTPTAFSVM